MIGSDRSSFEKIVYLIYGLFNLVEKKDISVICASETAVYEVSV